MPTSWPYLTLGDAQASSSLVFLHGFLGQGSDWLPVAERFSDRYHCILPDLPGHGAHTRLDLNRTLRFEDLAAGLAETLLAAGLQKPILVAYSLGARVALHFACTHPGRCAGLVLESVSPGFVAAAERSERAALDDARAARLLAAGLETFVDEWYQAGLWASLRQRPELLEQAVAARSANRAAWMAKVISELSPGRMPALWDCLPNLAMPVLVLAGLLDEKYSGLAPQVAGRIPGAQFCGIHDAGHNIHLEQPESCAAAIRDFLQRPNRPRK